MPRVGALRLAGLCWLCLAMVAATTPPAWARPRPARAPIGQPVRRSSPSVPSFAALTSEANLDRSRRLFERAEAHYRAGAIERALQMYRHAHRLAPLPGFLFNIAQCYRRLGKWSRALAYYRAYGRAVPDAPNRKQLQMLVNLCRRELAAKRRGAKGARPRHRSAAPAEPPFYSQRNASSVGARAQAIPAKDSSAASSKARPWLYAGVATGGALALAGTVTGILALSDSDEYRSAGTSAERRAELKQRGEALRTSSTVTLAVAGAVAVSTLVLYLVDRRDRQQRGAAVKVAPTKGGGAVVVAGRF
jgi:tetratricopeptide (TPR) repeat protein